MDAAFRLGRKTSQKYRVQKLLLGAHLCLFCGAAQADQVWHFKAEFLQALLRAVPLILKSQDPATGAFGTGVWIPPDQSVIYPLAAAWALKGPGNRYFHDPALLETILKGGDLLVKAQDENGRWMFRKKDNSTWGLHYDPWVYSRWVRTYSLISEGMPPERRARWQKGLELGYSGIEKHELSRVHNIPAHQAMGLYIAGKALAHPAWCDKARAFLGRVAQAQDTNGFWSEHVGPVVQYNLVYVDALGICYSLSRDETVMPAIQRAVRFHASFTYPDGSQIETIDERNPYLKTFHLPNPGFTFSAEGRGYLRQQWTRLREKENASAADAVASLLLYGEEGFVESPNGEGDSVCITADRKASVIRKGPWCACLSAYTAPIYRNRWIQDRQNFVSLFHGKTGLILGGGNTKLQPLWSTFTVGDPGLLKHRPGDENPDFSEPAGLLHVPIAAALARSGGSSPVVLPRPLREGQGRGEGDGSGTRLVERDEHLLQLQYGPAACSVSLELLGADRARLTFSAGDPDRARPVEAHVTFLPTIGKSWLAASGKRGRLDATPFQLTAAQAGAWFEHNGWRVELPTNSSLTWPVLPHNPYRKDGHAEPGEGRIVLRLPFSSAVATQHVQVAITE